MKYEVGQTVWVLNCCNGMMQEPVINEGVIEKAGRKYLTVKAGVCYKEFTMEEGYPYPEFRGKEYSPNNNMLMFDSRLGASDYWDKKVMVREIVDFIKSFHRQNEMLKLSIDDLKAIKAILHQIEEPNPAIKEHRYE